MLYFYEHLNVAILTWCWSGFYWKALIYGEALAIFFFFEKKSFIVWHTLSKGGLVFEKLKLFIIKVAFFQDTVKEMGAHLRNPLKLESA